MFWTRFALGRSAPVAPALSTTGPAPPPRAETGNGEPSRFSWNRPWMFALLLLFATLIAYAPALRGGFLWDDGQHVIKPELRSIAGLARIWGEPGATQQYYPLLWTAFWVEHRIWGDSTFHYHLINVVLHVVSALLLLRILRQLKIPGAFLASAIFALHPVFVESVAWISELKNILSGFFYLSAALAYINFDRNRKGNLYALALALFAFAVLSKTVTVTLPVALLVVFWWQRGTLSGKRDVLPLLPFFALGLAAGLFTAFFERRYLGAAGKNFDFSLLERCLIAGRAFWFYLGKLLWPANLIFIYPRWHVTQTQGWQFIYPVAALLFVGMLWAMRNRSRGPLAACLFFGATLFPALGFFNVFPFRFSFVADHFQYLAAIGPITLAGAGLVKLCGFCWTRIEKEMLLPRPEYFLMAGLGVLTWQQSAMYLNQETLWRTTIARNPDCFLAWTGLGTVLTSTGRSSEAATCFQRAIEIMPDYDEALNDLGYVWLQAGRVNEALPLFQKAVALKPARATYVSNLGKALFQQKHYEAALGYFQKAAALQPGDALLLNNLAWVLATCPKAALRNGPRAVDAAVKADHLTGEKEPWIITTLAVAYAEAGKFEDAIKMSEKAIALAASRQPGIAAQNRAFLELFRARKPYHESDRAN